MSTGLTQGELASAAGLRKATVCALERGQQIPRHKTAERISEVLGFPTELIFPQNDLDPDVTRAEDHELASGVATSER